MFYNYPGINWNLRLGQKKTKINIVIICSRRPRDYKTGNLTS